MSRPTAARALRRRLGSLVRALTAAAVPGSERAPAEPRETKPFELESAREMVDERIRELAETGALDEGTADVLDRLIDAWYAQKAYRIDAHFLDRQREAQRTQSRAEEDLRCAELDVEEARRRLAHLRGSLPGDDRWVPRLRRISRTGSADTELLGPGTDSGRKAA